ncbi:hypothetical protein [Bifidobacterium pseudolongum]|uniref:Uncharacterized protein n=1 Tax=Bifidobacterium pseudolongum subsp. globosum TaxID=1690 RepID=A0A4Q5AVJ2_9BIFI|nr:hypothetical protein [Bifidobacterium pseudolongum]RYQ37777.1 hypothetical protein PG2003B_0520 [Bifidobacterium pseudolongum subsp. globosum]
MDIKSNQQHGARGAIVRIAAVVVTEGVGNPVDPRSTGRVWTDKLVTTGDVTLVLDVSGSMARLPPGIWRRPRLHGLRQDR